ncbi:MAG: hypothetical protein ACRDD1_10465, partial [Planctomycetia bacterium]
WRLKALAVPKESLGRIAAAVGAGGTKADGDLPLLTVSDDAPTAVVLKGARGGWQAGPDPGGRPEGEWLAKPIPVEAAPSAVGALFVSAEGAGRAVVALDRGKDRAVVECFDLTAAPAPDVKPAKTARAGAGGGPEPIRFDVPFGAHALNLSRDGSRLLTRVADSAGRLDVWSVPDGKHLFGWRPYLKTAKDKDEQAVEGAVFVGHDRVLTIGKANILTMWELPACRPVFSIANFNHQGGSASDSIRSHLASMQSRADSVLNRIKKGEISPEELSDPAALEAYLKGESRDGSRPYFDPARLPAVSPGGRYLALMHADELLFLDAATGETKGAVPVRGLYGAGAFDPSGRKFALTVQRPVGAMFLVVEMASGEVSAEFPLPVAGKNLQWCNFQHLIMDGQWLVDVDKKRVGWSYRMPNTVHAPLTPDGRHWAMLPRAPSSQRSSLAAVELPDEAVAKKLAAATADNQYILSPGGKISV